MYLVRDNSSKRKVGRVFYIVTPDEVGVLASKSSGGQQFILLWLKRKKYIWQIRKIHMKCMCYMCYRINPWKIMKQDVFDIIYSRWLLSGSITLIKLNFGFSCHTVEAYKFFLTYRFIYIKIQLLSSIRFWRISSDLILAIWSAHLSRPALMSLTTSTLVCSSPPTTHRFEMFLRRIFLSMQSKLTAKSWLSSSFQRSNVSAGRINVMKRLSFVVLK